jgi:hypothetical protein
MSHLNRYWHLKHKTVSYFPLSLTGPWVSTPGKYIDTLATCVYVDSGFNSRVISDFKRRVLPLDDVLHFGIYVVNGDQRVLHLFGKDTNTITVELFYYPIWSSQAVLPRILFILIVLSHKSTYSGGNSSHSTVALQAYSFYISYQISCIPTNL